MKKLGSILAVISGITFIIAGSIGLAMAYDAITNQDLAKDYGEQVAKIQNRIDMNQKAIYFTIIGIGLLEVLLGIWAFNDSKGISAFVLFGLYALIFGYTLYSSIDANSWPTPTIVQLSVTGVAALGLLSGLIGDE